MVNIHGLTVDDESRCTHYHTPLDIIAIKFKCCNKFYPCYKCHNENENHDFDNMISFFPIISFIKFNVSITL